MTNVEIVAELIKRYKVQDVRGAYELYHPDVTVDSLFALPLPSQSKGKAVMLERLEAREKAANGKIPKMYEGIELRDLRVHQTVDPNVVIAEWVYVTVNESGETLNPNVIVVEFKDGLIYKSRDYHNYITRAKANGVLPELLDNIEKTLI